MYGVHVKYTEGVIKLCRDIHMGIQQQWYNTYTWCSFYSNNFSTDFGTETRCRFNTVLAVLRDKRLAWKTLEHLCQTTKQPLYIYISHYNYIFFRSGSTMGDVIAPTTQRIGKTVVAPRLLKLGSFKFAGLNCQNPSSGTINFQCFRGQNYWWSRNPAWTSWVW